MARHWLDVARYADTAGFANDYERPNAWRYRDYVVRSFNEDKPFDRFVTRADSPATSSAPDDPEALVAVGFLRMGPWEQTGMSVAKVTRQQFLDDVTDPSARPSSATRSSAPAATTTSSTRSRPATTTRIQAVFATTQFADRDAPFLPAENDRSGLDERALPARTHRPLRGVAGVDQAKEEAAARAWYAERGLDYAPEQKFQQEVPAEDEVVPKSYGLTPEDLGLERIARKYLERHRWELDRYRPIAFSVYSGTTRQPSIGEQPDRAAGRPHRGRDDRADGDPLRRRRLLADAAGRAGRPELRPLLGRHAADRAGDPRQRRRPPAGLRRLGRQPREPADPAGRSSTASGSGTSAAASSPRPTTSAPGARSRRIPSCSTGWPPSSSTRAGRSKRCTG